MKKIIIAIVAGLVVVSAVVLLTGRTAGVPAGVEATNSNVSVVDGVQIIEITAKGRYTPGLTSAKADMPTTIRFKTNTTFDCSTAVRVPSLNISKNLPPNGETDIDIGPQGVGRLDGMCSMGMYFFAIDFI